MSSAIIWLRRDLRLHDNPAWHYAAQAHDTVIPVYIHAPDEESPWQPGAASRWWLHHSLQSLQAALRERGERLIIRQGDSLTQLRSLLEASQADAVYWNRLYDPATRNRDQQIKQALREEGWQADSFNSALLWEPWTVKTQAGEPYKVFTPFWKACCRHLPTPPLAAPDVLAPPANDVLNQLASLPLEALELRPKISWDGGLQSSWQVGETGAWTRLEQVCEQVVDDYSNTRNLPALDGVSRLSPHLHFGELSPRQIWQAVAERFDGTPLEHLSAAAYLRELGWREFAHHVLFYWPESPVQAMNERFRAMPWRQDYAADLARWQHGRTGIPLVDAGMRELWQTGWMHNRVRMIVASFLSKNLLIPWQEGTRWFWDTLVDADLANNSMGWQWTAGCGVDAAPYFRVFNPVRQGEQFDPDGDYVRRWVPELAAVPIRWVHQPWNLPVEQQRQAKFQPGVSYPLPIVDLAASRKRALGAYEQIKG